MENMDTDIKTILVVDDEESIREILVYNLEREGYRVIEAADGEHAIDLITNKTPDLVLLDVMLPKKDGISVCKEVRYNLENMDLPIIILSAKGEETDKIIGLEIGADDYVTKPFQIREVLARVKANLRKLERNKIRSTDEPEKIVHKELEIDLKKRNVTVAGDLINLTKKEFDVLKFLALQPGTVISREDLLQQVWGYGDYVGEIRTIDVTMARLRDKIERKKGSPEYIITKRGVGYYLSDGDK